MWSSKYPNLVVHVTFVSGKMSTLTSTHLQE